jgi:hypothetical protein
VFKRLRLDPVLAALLIITFVSMVATAHVLPTIYFLDEIFQGLEPAFLSPTGNASRWGNGVRASGPGWWRDSSACWSSSFPPRAPNAAGRQSTSGG